MQYKQLKNKVKEMSKSNEVSLTQKNQDTIKNLFAQRNAIDKTIQDITMVILDTLEVDYKDKPMKFSEDFTKIIIE
jgi:hypothetical protein